MTFKIKSEHNVTLTTDQIWQLIELVSTNNQYNEDKEEIESWNQIVSIFEGVLDTFYTKLEEAQSKQPTPDW
tara:strand:- start:226 stop:441 length:216 start_codon:yes stop_codon:yes gene_type:complete